MSDPLKLVLLYGGKSGEHEISLISAASVLANLDSSRYQIIPVGMDKVGKLFINDYDELIGHKDALPVQTKQSKQLDSLIMNGRLAIDADVVFPVVHGPLYEDGCLQGILSLADVAYVGCDVLASAIGMNKDMARRLAKLEGIKSPEYLTLPSNLTEHEIKSIAEQAVNSIGFPLFVKPVSLGSSVGIHKVNTFDELMFAIKDAGRFDEEVMVEASITGREIELAVLEDANPSNPPKVAEPGEVKVGHVDGFYSYVAKYIESNCTELSIPAKLDESVCMRFKEAAQTIFKSLKCKGMARVDFFYDEKDDEIYFNEINSIPGFTTISMYAKLWEHTGLSYPLLLNKLINLALAHQQKKLHRVTHYQ
jgi:D-alanine-D-alanine ligase